MEHLALEKSHSVKAAIPNIVTRRSTVKAFDIIDINITQEEQIEPISLPHPDKGESSGSGTSLALWRLEFNSQLCYRSWASHLMSQFPICTMGE